MEAKNLRSCQPPHEGNLGDARVTTCSLSQGTRFLPCGIAEQRNAKLMERDMYDNNDLFWYSMKLNEVYGLDHNTSVWRVPGGWVMSTAVDMAETAVFIPFNNEFMPGMPA